MMKRSWPPIAFVAAVFGCGAIDAAFEAQGALVDKHAPAVGRIEAWGLFVGASFAGNAVACAAAFAAGRALAAVAA
jgi:hypothetical protein